MRAADIITASILFLFGGLVIVDAMRLGIGWGMDGPKSGFFPFWLALIMMVAAAHDSAIAQTCVGDCDGDGMVLVNELVIGVNIALDAQPLSECPNLDNGDGQVTVDVLVTAVNNLLEGCGTNATPGTPTPTVTPGAGTTTPTGSRRV